MSWNGSGVFNRLFSWTADAAAGINITASRMDSDTNDITSNGFANCLTRDGQGFATAPLPMAGFRHTGVGDAQARSDYASAGQVQDAVALNWTVAGGSADAITATFTPSLTVLVDGQYCCVRATAANATTTPTFAPNGLTAHTITKLGGTALVPGDIAGNFAEVILRYNLAHTRWELLNPAQPLPIVPLGALIPYTGSTAPNANFILPAGQAISRTTYAAYFALVGTTYGTGDGSTTFNVPDLRGRVLAALDNLNGSAANRVTNAGSGITGTTLGAAGGAQNTTLAQANLPNVNLTSNAQTTTVWGAQDARVPVTGGSTFVTTFSATNPGGTNTSATLDIGGQTVPLGGSGTAVNDMQPTIMVAYLLRVL